MNRLSGQTSPYLLQHAGNPVDWFPWGQEAFEKARSENKLMLFSIGYSACHWCHVMEHEVFEDFECAEVMNAHFVCVKVDREEHPDVDHIYMDALHVMGQRGGWPLNVFALPDGRPIYGGTYIPKQSWIRILDSLSELWSREPDKMFEYAEKVAAGIRQLSLFDGEKVVSFDPEVIDKVVEHWSGYWDRAKGGMRKAPKFPMPTDWRFLLTYGNLMKNHDALNFAFFTLRRMGLGGIYDHVGGGFARYSVDEDWKVPHFEKMLYDNAQLIQAYAHAYSINQDALFLRIVDETTAFIEREWKSEQGLYFSATDADSEGEEGKYYIWTLRELSNAAGEDMPFIEQWFSLDEKGLWEHGNYVLLRDPDKAREFTESGHENALKDKFERLRSKLAEVRSARVKPGIDHKCLTSWNAMLVSAWCETYLATGNEAYRQRALDLMGAIQKFLIDESGRICHQRTSGLLSGHGYADDYAFVISALIASGRSGCGDDYFLEAERYTEEMMKRFFDGSSGFFRLSPTNESSLLFASKTEVSDNVIPSVNSEMCINLLILSRISERPEWEELAAGMLGTVLPSIDFASGYTNWLRGYVYFSHGISEVVCVGIGYRSAYEELRAMNRQDILVVYSTGESELPMVRSKSGKDPGIYVCRNKTCFPPVTDIREAITLLA